MSAVGSGKKLIDGRYRLDQRVRSGGTSVRWLGYDERLGQPVMVDEFFVPSGGADAAFLARLSCQLRLGVQLARHPRVLAVRGMIDTGNQPWLLFDAERGVPLKELLDRRRILGVQETRLIATHVLEALAAMHAEGFIHRDVKPTNIIVAPDGSAQLTGCDIVWDRTVGAVEPKDSVVGTPAMMAPERFRGVSDDPRGDVFGLGVTLYHALSGASPFQRDSMPETMAAIASDVPAPLPYGDAFSKLVLRMLAKDPDHRPTAEEALAQLGAMEVRDRRLFPQSAWMPAIDVEIDQAWQTRADSLDLSAHRARELPDSIGSLTNLRRLGLAGMGLESIPPGIAQLRDLELLDLSGNNLRAIPPEIRELTRLRELRLSGNPLGRFPEPVADLTRLAVLDLARVEISEIPDHAFELMHELVRLDLSDNPLREIPVASLTRLPRLRGLALNGLHQLEYPPPAIAGQGPEAVMAFLRAAAAAPTRQWRSKLLIVGEGGVGKTTLLKVLAGREVDAREPTTHGLNIEELALAHPEEPGVTMRLAAWDFGGQQIYHAVHQFFLTGQSLMVLVWNARAGWEQSRGRYWLDQIVARTGDRDAVPVLLVATHCADRAPDLPLAELMGEYPQIIGSVQVDAFAGATAIWPGPR